MRREIGPGRGALTGGPGLQRVFWAVLLGFTFAPSVLAQNYRFFYNLAPGTGFLETSHSRQTSGRRVISEFHERVQFQVSRERDSTSPNVSARILSLSNMGRRIDYYDGVTFQARITATGEVRNRAFSGGDAYIFGSTTGLDAITAARPRALFPKADR